ncbi:hypothetical protein TrispH2_003564 [Trichoplax sp. H2]|nr:hypothetical protein TrispH2_003564 [Trichoplax sp. H2]|eukprot:RDD45546.1 hypothetical protein TrispH2_003564 [Trichoplax sp. H2]
MATATGFRQRPSSSKSHLTSFPKTIPYQGYSAAIRKVRQSTAVVDAFIHFHKSLKDGSIASTATVHFDRSRID